MYGGGQGTSYSGGTGSGGMNANDKAGPTYNRPGESNGGTGGVGRVYRYDASWGARNSAGGAGNPGGNGASHTSGAKSNEGNNINYKGNDGTGGLLIIYSNIFENNGMCRANGVDATSTIEPAGGASGGGSINIFYNKIENYGKFEAKGGQSVNHGGAGGNGTVTIGSIKSGSFVKDEINLEEEQEQQ